MKISSDMSGVRRDFVFSAIVQSMHYYKQLSYRWQRDR